MDKKYILKLLEFDRTECEEEYLNGYLLDYSKNWVLISVAHEDFFLNGHTIIRNDCIKRYRLLDDYNNFFDRALKKLKFVPSKAPYIDLHNLNSILDTVNNKHPVFTVHRELLDNQTCYVGSLQKTTLKTFFLNLINPGAEYDGNCRINKKDVTRIDFDGNYEKCLWLMASKATRKKIEGG